MPAKTIVRTAIILVIIISNIGCDQVTKEIVREKVVRDETISLLSNHLTVTNVENSGAFLSIGNSLSQTTKNIVLSLLPALAIAVALFYTLTKQGMSRAMLLGLCFIIGGGIGNIFDRIVYGSVTDFLHIRVGQFQTGIFNMADVSIMTGACIITLHAALKRKQQT